MGALCGWHWALRGEDVEGDRDGNGEGAARSGKVSVRCVLGCSKL